MPEDHKVDFGQAYKGLAQSYEQGMAHGNAEWVAALFADDAAMLAPGSDPLKGRGAVLAHLQELLQAFDVQMKIEPAEVEELGEKGWATGAYKATVAPKDGGAARELTGKYMQVVQPREDGTLEILRHCVAADQPLP